MVFNTETFYWFLCVVMAVCIAFDAYFVGSIRQNLKRSEELKHQLQERLDLLNKVLEKPYPYKDISTAVGDNDIMML